MKFWGSYPPKLECESEAGYSRSDPSAPQVHPPALDEGMWFVRDSTGISPSNFSVETQFF